MTCRLFSQKPSLIRKVASIPVTRLVSSAPSSTFALLSSFPSEQAIGSNSRHFIVNTTLAGSSRSLSLVSRQLYSSSSSSSTSDIMSQTNAQTENTNNNIQKESEMIVGGLDTTVSETNPEKIEIKFQPKEVRFPVSWGHIAAKVC